MLTGFSNGFCNFGFGGAGKGVGEGLGRAWEGLERGLGRGWGMVGEGLASILQKQSLQNRMNVP